VCHDAADPDMARCRGCLTQWHTDCTPTKGICPMVGCGAPVEGADPAAIARAAAKAVRMASKAKDEGAPPRPRRGPSAWARVGPYGRLLGHAVAAALALGFVALVLLAAARYRAETWRILTFAGSPDTPLPIILFYDLVIAAILGGFTYYPLTRLAEVVRLLGEVHRILHETTPVPMRLTISSSSTGHGSMVRLQLEGRVGPLAGQTFEFSVDPQGLPWWMTTRSRSDEPVLVYGLPPPGPYLIELDSGALTLVQP
jgi:hypothetical protein